MTNGNYPDASARRALSMGAGVESPELPEDRQQPGADDLAKEVDRLTPGEKNALRLAVRAIKDQRVLTELDKLLAK